MGIFCQVGARSMWCLFLFATITVSIVFLMTRSGWAVDTSFACGGKVEKNVWELWDKDAKKILSEIHLQGRLVNQGDVYALYDFQSYTNNLLAMAQRCNRIERLQEFSRLIEVAYTKLEPPVFGSAGRKWICRGGTICNDKNKLLNKEVMLDSVQFLGLASSAANALATSKTLPTEADKLFIRDTAQIIIEHLLRWSEKADIDAIHKAQNATVQDVKSGGSSALLFTDKYLWLISIYSELAGILNSAPSFELEISANNKAQLSYHFSNLLELFKSRLTIYPEQNKRLGNAILADLDRGYWSLFDDNAYAGYEKADKPVMCNYSGSNKSKYRIVVAVAPDKIPRRQDIGWDISHARRLVQALDALERNRQSVKKTFAISEKQLPPEGISNAFANTFIGLAWNGDKVDPLFSNYLNGANGWYRVAYDNGTGACREGTPPYGLTDSFPTGGYVAWAKYNPTIGMLGKRLYSLFNSTKPDDIAFVSKYYELFAASARKKDMVLRYIMFLPSLVGVSIQ